LAGPDWAVLTDLNATVADFRFSAHAVPRADHASIMT
jgi:hypothetical protein